MKASDLQTYLRSLNGGWMNLDATVDTFKAGQPDADVRGIAVGWMSYTWALRRAIELGCNLFVTHEPTYYNHLDDDPRIFDLPGTREKRRFIEENELVILRCHDLWDQAPDIGIPDSWGAWLGFDAAIAGEGYFRVYDVAGRTAAEVARQVARRVAPLGQPAVELIGPPDAPVSRVCIGTGAITPFLKFIRAYQVDLAICTDDGIAQWRDGGYAIDMGVPIIVANHAVSEEAGVASLARRIQQAFPEVPVRHIPQRCMYTLVHA
jgi:putative NIF3 family GTP cyclohydrolase 1 type 2